MAVAGTDLTIAPPCLEGFEIGFFREAVASGERGEEGPLVGGGEAARTVVAAVGLEQVYAFVVVVHTAEEACCGAVSLFGGSGVCGAVGEVEVRQRIVEETGAAHIEIVVALAFGSAAHHHFQVVVFRECLVVGREHIDGVQVVAVSLTCRSRSRLTRRCVERERRGSPVVPHGGRSVGRIVAHVAHLIGEVGLQGETFDDLCLQPALESGLVHPFLIHMRAVAYAHLIAEIVDGAGIVLPVAVGFEERREAPHVLVGVAAHVRLLERAVEIRHTSAGFQPREYFGLHRSVHHVAGEFFGVVTHKAFSRVIAVADAIGCFARRAFQTDVVFLRGSRTQKGLSGVPVGIAHPLPVRQDGIVAHVVPALEGL